MPYALAKTSSWSIKGEYLLNKNRAFATLNLLGQTRSTFAWLCQQDFVTSTRIDYGPDLVRERRNYFKKLPLCQLAHKNATVMSLLTKHVAEATVTLVLNEAHL